MTPPDALCGNGDVRRVIPFESTKDVYVFVRLDEALEAARIGG